MSQMDPKTLILRQVETLFRLDGRGRLLAVNSPEDLPVPRFFMGRTVEGSVWRFRNDLPDGLVAEIEALCREEPPAADLETPPVSRDAILAVLRAHAPVGGERRGPNYVFDRLPSSSGRAVLVDEANQHLLERYFPDETYPAEGGPAAIVVDDGVAVARCFCSRLTDAAAEAGLETAESYRRRGYGVEVTARWAAAVFASGRLPLYSTTWDNHASRTVAARLGLRLYGEDWSID